MRCQSIPDIVRETRERRGLSQRRLAIRAATSQDAISRIERGAEAPTFERLAGLMLAMGVELSVEARPIGDTVPRRETTTGTPTDPAARLREAASWNLLASQLEIAGERAREARHPATRIGSQ